MPTGGLVRFDNNGSLIMGIVDFLAWPRKPKRRRCKINRSLAETFKTNDREAGAPQLSTHLSSTSHQPGASSGLATAVRGQQGSWISFERLAVQDV
jgi:hypothetical protein